MTRPPLEALQQARAVALEQAYRPLAERSIVQATADLGALTSASGAREALAALWPAVLACNPDGGRDARTSDAIRRAYGRLLDRA